MTDVPTTYDLFELFILPPLLAFFIAFLIHYSRSRSIKEGMMTGLFSLIVLVLVIISFIGMNWIHLGIISGILTGTIGSFTDSTSSKEKLTMQSISDMIKKK
ncbi:hypothetical protein [Methanolobus sp. WCC4]|uniref:hypothetical protein n=1 Tax=Methanolobus sp. WCC4 TaxID=3125784 RepID=UPI0030FBC006